MFCAGTSQFILLLSKIIGVLLPSELTTCTGSAELPALLCACWCGWGFVGLQGVAGRGDLTGLGSFGGRRSASVSPFGDVVPKLL